MCPPQALQEECACRIAANIFPMAKISTIRLQKLTFVFHLKVVESDLKKQVVGTISGKTLRAEPSVSCVREVGTFICLTCC